MIYTIDDVANILGVHPRTVRRYIENGTLRGDRVGGSWRVSEEAVREMFTSPELKDSFMKRVEERSEDMLSLYLQGKHRLQQKGLVVLLAFVFSPEKEPWVLGKSGEWMAELNRHGESAQFDFTLTGSEQGMYRLSLIAAPSVSRAMIEELERLRTMA